MSLVEVIRGPDTSDSTVASVVLHAKGLKKVPVVVKDSLGFLVNRVLTPYLHESVELLREGVDPSRIDKVLDDLECPRPARAIRHGWP